MVLVCVQTMNLVYRCITRQHSNLHVVGASCPAIVANAVVLFGRTPNGRLLMPRLGTCLRSPCTQAEQHQFQQQQQQQQQQSWGPAGQSAGREQDATDGPHQNSSKRTFRAVAKSPNTMPSIKNVDRDLELRGLAFTP